MSIHSVLMNMRVLLATPDHWTRGAMARDAAGNTIIARDERAMSFCLIGGIIKLARDEVEIELVAKFLSEHLGMCVPDEHCPTRDEAYNVAHFNDSHPYPEMLSFLDSAIMVASRGQWYKELV